MNTVLCNALLAVTLIVVPTGSCLAGGLYQLRGYPTFGGSVTYANGETVVFEPVPAPVYARLKLSGESPYDHTDIVSLTFTPAGGEVLGYVGDYVGKFDSSTGTITEDPSGKLWSSGHERESRNLLHPRTAFVDLDAPPVYTTDASEGINSSLILSFFVGSKIHLRQTETTTLGNSSFELPHNSVYLTGNWFRAIPEPKSLALVSCGVFLLFIASRNWLPSAGEKHLECQDF